MEKRPTIEDVAKMAGVAKSTVSRYLNGKPVRKESVGRIRQAIEHYNYETNVFARLSAKQSRECFKTIKVTKPKYRQVKQRHENRQPSFHTG